MSGPAPQPTTFYVPAELAEMLRCSVWWVKDQARKRRIPYCWIGGGYRFTPEHVAEIVRLSEVRPVEPVVSSRWPQPRSVAAGGPARLQPRVPRRVRAAGSASIAA
ncbi:hypothetical protein Val02_93310 [Virgisporangium aliadipatigenens]|uniref:Helix-turn-helix domain-containing protein n=1 Tax=Virgisporangium aliadipatigenens TaxID=741659 RepID=A0A8J3YZC3_9ACTN|nr:hypothetical protein Val02_93310 [Virgisporangium aliadipatigenens]